MDGSRTRISRVAIRPRPRRAVHYGQPVEGSSTDFGLTGGVGLAFPVGRMQGRVEARLHNIFGEGSSAQMYPLSTGVMF